MCDINRCMLIKGHHPLNILLLPPLIIQQRLIIHIFASIHMDPSLFLYYKHLRPHMITPVFDQSDILKAHSSPCNRRESMSPFTTPSILLLKYNPGIIISRKPYILISTLCARVYLCEVGSPGLILLLSRFSESRVNNMRIGVARGAVWKIEPRKEVIFKPFEEEFDVVGLVHVSLLSEVLWN